MVSTRHETAGRVVSHLRGSLPGAPKFFTEVASSRSQKPRRVLVKRSFQGVSTCVQVVEVLSAVSGARTAAESLDQDA
jgi:hypothetical protein